MFCPVRSLVSLGPLVSAQSAGVLPPAGARNGDEQVADLPAGWRVVLQCHGLQLPRNHRRGAVLTEIHKVLSSLCDKHSLPLAQTWIPSSWVRLTKPPAAAEPAAWGLARGSAGPVGANMRSSVGVGWSMRREGAGRGKGAVDVGSLQEDVFEVFHVGGAGRGGEAAGRGGVGDGEEEQRGEGGEQQGGEAQGAEEEQGEEDAVTLFTADMPSCVADLRMWGFRQACCDHQLQAAQGCPGRAMTSNAPAFCDDLQLLSKEQYPLVHYARMFGLRAAVAIRLRSVLSKEMDYVLGCQPIELPNSAQWWGAILLVSGPHLTTPCSRPLCTCRCLVPPPPLAVRLPNSDHSALPSPHPLVHLTWRTRVVCRSGGQRRALLRALLCAHFRAHFRAHSKLQSQACHPQLIPTCLHSRPSASVVSLRVGLRGGPCGADNSSLAVPFPLPQPHPPFTLPPSPSTHGHQRQWFLTASERGMVEQRWSRGGAEVEQRWSRGGAEVEQRWSRGGAEVVPLLEQRWAYCGGATRPAASSLPPPRRGRHPWALVALEWEGRRAEGRGGRGTLTHSPPSPHHCHSPAPRLPLPLSRVPPVTATLPPSPHHCHSPVPLPAPSPFTALAIAAHPPSLRHLPHRSPAAMPASPAPPAAAARHVLRLRGRARAALGGVAQQSVWKGDAAASECAEESRRAGGKGRVEERPARSCEAGAEDRVTGRDE
ncbi:unnamed protein product [Closterium sp. Naga37s-1]|nr:unnamed protein product [Closterium sp. Naga37s-1]